MAVLCFRRKSYLVFINDIPLSIWDSMPDIYAENTTLSKSASWENTSHINHALNQDLKPLAEWSALNKRFINTQKAKSMLVTGGPLWNKVGFLFIYVSLNGNSFQNVTDFKLLGITFDQGVTFDRQVEELSKKLVKRMISFVIYWCCWWWCCCCYWWWWCCYC